MNNKRFKTLSGYWSNISPVKEGKKNHNFAEGHIQTGMNQEEKVLFFFQKPNTTSAAYENALTACREKKSSLVSGLSEDSEGCFLTCRTTEIKPKAVIFERRKSSNETTDLNAIVNNDVDGILNDDTVTITGRIFKLHNQTIIKKFDSTKQSKIDKVCRGGVIANETGALIIMLWENLAKEIVENDNITLKHMRKMVDANGITFFSSTFRTEFTKSTTELSNYDEEGAQELFDVKVQLFKETVCVVESVVVDINTVCPRCKTKCTSDERIVTCSNSACGASFKRKTNSIRADITARDDKNECLYLTAYQDVLGESAGEIDKDTIIDFFMDNDDKFKIMYHFRSKVIEKIQSN
ncbi:unnamed protein product [Adineta steineri]|uniref:Uncharacterized protein n=1 Tax=Adineta steineri TaxID=433720 RepID=A0A816A3H4_9BILA|nr:unnamed protein product [Adineta steineri]CAF1592551.1 unnamed protein product [Adineta steineri]